MQQAIIIREATKSDAEAIASIHSLSWQSTYRNIMTDGYLDKELPDIKRSHWQKVCNDPPTGAVLLIAYSRNEPIGFIAAYKDHIPDYDYYIDNIHVQPTLKGKGIGKRLMAAAMDKILSLGATSVALTVFIENTSAIAFYKKLGGKIVGESTQTFDGRDLPDYLIGWKNARDMHSDTL